MIKIITSPQNPLIKQIALLSQKAKSRKETNLFVLEGLQELYLAIKGGYKVKTILFNPQIITYNKIHEELGNSILEIETIEINRIIYEKLAYRESTEGILAIANCQTHNLIDFECNTKNPLLLIAESPEKPGNIGALLRTADAAGIDGVIIVDPNTDLYNPNVIRASVGCLFTVPIYLATTEEVLHFLLANKINLYCALIDSNSKSCFEVDYGGAIAIMVGPESKGLSKIWGQNSTKNIIIPMHGKVDSMNLSVSAGILLYEAVRKRRYQ